MKPETEIRNLKRQLKDEVAVAWTMRQQVEHYRVRAMKAEQELAEWKERFDVLLRAPYERERVYTDEPHDKTGMISP